ncbi:hypothetical protein [Mycoplasma sp. 125]|uniref:hypothetical protein n=1 Tax=Mycoplasma sp. 125 TaxID=3447505 RepID=UPI003F6584D2
MTKKSKLFLLGTSSALLVPIMTISCATKKEPNKPNNPSNPVNPQDSQKPKKTPQTPSSIELLGFDKEELNKPSIDKSITEEDFNRQIGKQNSQKQTNPSTDDKKPHKPSIKLDENAFKNIAPDIIFDYNEPSNEQIQKIVNNYYNQYLYQKYDPSKEGKGIRFSFLLEEENKNPLNTDKIIFNKDIIIDGKKQKQKQQEYLKQLSKIIVSDLKNNTQASLNGNNNSITLSLFEKEQQEEILNTFEEHIKNKWNGITRSFVYDETLFTSNNLSVETFKNSISEYYKAADPAMRTIKQLLQDKADVDRYFNMLQPLLGGFVDLKEFGDKFVLFNQNKFITQEEIKRKKITHGDFNKLIQYRKDAIRELSEKITYKTWLKNKNDEYYTLLRNPKIHKMHNYNIALTQLWTLIAELNRGSNLIKIDKEKLDPALHTQAEVIAMLKNPETKKKTENAFYAQYMDKIFTNIFNAGEKETRWDKNQNYVLEYKAQTHHYKKEEKSEKIYLLTRLVFDNKETDEFLIKYTFRWRKNSDHLHFKESTPALKANR